MKRVALICGSPKAKRSASEALLRGVRSYLADGDEVLECRFSTAVPSEKDLLQLCNCRVLVFAFPLYVDGVPGHLLACLERLEQTLKIAPAGDRTVYAFCNCGFYEGEQARTALDMLAHWCARAGVRWGYGVGVGGGGMLAETEGLPLGKGPKKDIGRAAMALARDADAGKGGENVFVSVNFPRAAYKAAAEFGWRQSVKRNGLRAKDLGMKR